MTESAAAKLQVNGSGRLGFSRGPRRKTRAYSGYKLHAAMFRR